MLDWLFGEASDLVEPFTQAADSLATELAATVSVADQVAVSHLPDGTTVLTEIFDLSPTNR